MIESRNAGNDEEENMEQDIEARAGMRAELFLREGVSVVLPQRVRSIGLCEIFDRVLDDRPTTEICLTRDKIRTPGCPSFRKPNAECYS